MKNVILGGTLITDQELEETSVFLEDTAGAAELLRSFEEDGDWVLS